VLGRFTDRDARSIPEPPGRAIGSAAFSTERSPMKSTPRSLFVIALIMGGVLVNLGSAAAPDDGEPGAKVKLEKLNWKQFQARLAENQSIKYTLVDAWSTTCGPCKENFPHVLEMHKKFAGKGLQVISLSLDDPDDESAVKEARKFLESKKSKIINILLDESSGGGFEKLNINAIPAVFVYGPDGKEIKRFTMDDTKNQFTYDQVEKAISELLDAKS
jgi:thiol-disulfide isomerase/thioredoxin